MPLFALCFLLLSSVALAEETTPYVPPALAPWVPWVLHDNPAVGVCPSRFDQANWQCAWASPLRLDLSESGGRFQQKWQVFSRDLLTLPGDVRNWPEGVTLNNEAAVVLERDGRPVVMVEAGSYQVEGQLVWERLPERLKLPPEVGLVAVSVADQALSAPELNNDYLWLRSALRETAGSEARDPASDHQGDRLVLQVFRRLQDGQPLLLTTHLTLDVAGREREVSLPTPLPATTLALAIRSLLPASLNANGELRLQLRPGHWEVEVDSRFPAQLEALVVPTLPAPWPEQEVWAFQADPSLRLVEPAGLTPLDPRQTHMPALWHHLPAFLAKPGETWHLATLQRGDAHHEPDRLQLKRTLWWDFDGAGLTVVDQLSGNLLHDGRLSTPMLPLGQVSLGGQPQFVTRLTTEADGARPGVEVRRGALNLRAESHWPLGGEGANVPLSSSLFGVAVTLPANGWDRDLQAASTTLNLGPGWSLFAAFNLDNPPPTWLSGWSLLDLFLVLITVVATRQLDGAGLAVATGLALVLCWHLEGAPQLGWINLIAATALLKVLPEGAFARAVRRYRLVSAVVIGVMLLAVLLHTVRDVLHPQLERDGAVVAFSVPLLTNEDAPASPPMPTPAAIPSETEGSANDAAASQQAEAAARAEPASRQAAAPSGGGQAAAPAKEDWMRQSVQIASFPVAKSAKPYAYRTSAPPLPPMPTIDPEAKIQTGPGIPTWHWQSLDYSWNGPVAAGQTITLWLFNPVMTKAWRLAELLGALFLAWLTFAPLRRSSPPSSTSAGDPVPLEGNNTSPMDNQTTPAGNPRLSMDKQAASAGKPMPASHDLSATVASVGSALLLLMVLGGAALWSSQPLAASLSTEGDVMTGGGALPSPELLEELRSRLTAPPRCLPGCALLERLAIRAGEDELSLTLAVNAAIQTAIPLPIDPRRWQPTTLLQDGLPLGAGSRWQDGVLWQVVPAGRHVLVLRGPLLGENLALPMPIKPHRLVMTTPGWQVDGVNSEGQPGDQLLLYRQHETPQPTTTTEAPRPLPLFVKVERIITLGLDWQVETRVKRLSPNEVGASLRLPLLAGEAVQTEGLKVTDGQVEVSLPAGRDSIRFTSRLTPGPQLTLTAPRQPEWFEVWQLVASPLWHTELHGILPIYGHAGNDHPVWQPFPGEQVEIAVSRPVGVAGATLTLEGARLQLVPGERLTEATLTLALHSSQGGQHVLHLPEGAELLHAQVDGHARPLRLEQGGVVLPLGPSLRRYEITWRTKAILTPRYESPRVAVGLMGVNAEVELQLPADRWLLWTSGPLLGPAVLFWGIVVVCLMAAWGLGRGRYTPLTTVQWALLGLGLSQLGVYRALAVVVLPFALAKRAKLEPSTLSPRGFQWLQIGLVVLLLVAGSALVQTVERGLLGIPEMAVTGNGSVAGHLQWYADRFSDVLPIVTVYSLPLWSYRVVMLLWALWLALLLVRLTPWMWSAWSSGGYWRSKQKGLSWTERVWRGFWMARAEAKRAVGGE